MRGSMEKAIDEQVAEVNNWWAGGWKAAGEAYTIITHQVDGSSDYNE